MSVLTPTNISFILQGLQLTLYISFISIVLSTLIGTVLAVMRNGKNPVLGRFDSERGHFHSSVLVHGLQLL